jgi:hypothetical protein
VRLDPAIRLAQDALGAAEGLEVELRLVGHRLPAEQARGMAVCLRRTAHKAIVLAAQLERQAARG